MRAVAGCLVTALMLALVAVTVVYVLEQALL